MSERSWKRCEREIATILGGRRVPVTGRARGDVPDIRHRWLSIEVKSRKYLPAWLKDAIAQARAAATEHQLPVAILHEQGARHGSDLVVMRLSDFTDWFGGAEHGQEGNIC
jgi:hypothetical protein